MLVSKIIIHVYHVKYFNFLSLANYSLFQISGSLEYYANTKCGDVAIPDYIYLCILLLFLCFTQVKIPTVS